MPLWYPRHLLLREIMMNAVKIRREEIEEVLVAHYPPAVCCEAAITEVGSYCEHNNVTPHELDDDEIGSLIADKLTSQNRWKYRIGEVEWNIPSEEFDCDPEYMNHLDHIDPINMDQDDDNFIVK
jgi:hypothetical protein